MADLGQEEDEAFLKEDGFGGDFGNACGFDGGVDDGDWSLGFGGGVVCKERCERFWIVLQGGAEEMDGF